MPGKGDRRLVEDPGVRLLVVPDEHHLWPTTIVGARRIALREEPTVLVVNAYRALEGRLRQDMEITGNSDIEIFEETLLEFSKNWSRNILVSAAEVLRKDLDCTQRIIGERMRVLEASDEEYQRLLEEDGKRSQEHMEILENRCQEARGDIEGFEDELRGTLRRWKSDTASRMRNSMRTKMSGGIVDGPKLADAFREEQADAMSEIVETLQIATSDVREKIAGRFGDIKDWRFQGSQTYQEYRSKERVKFENLLPRAASLGGVAGGAWPMFDDPS